MKLLIIYIMLYSQNFIDYIFDYKLNNLNNTSKKNILLLGDGFFARGFLHQIDYKKYNITQIYRDEFINPQDIFYSLQRNIKYEPDKHIHFRDKIKNLFSFFNKKNITKIKEDIKTLTISEKNATINNKLYYYDFLIVGLGSQKSLKMWTDELNNLTKIKNNNTIDIIGTGPVGFEIAMMLNKYYKINMYDILTEDKIFSYVNLYHKNFILDLLNKKNIKLHLGGFYDENNEQNKNNYKIFCVGTKPNDLTKNMSVNLHFNLITPKTLYENKIMNLCAPMEIYDNIFLGGDCVNTGYIKNAQVAYQQGIHIAKKLNGEIDKYAQFNYESNGIALNIDDKKVLIENHNILPNGIYPDFITHLYSMFCI